MNMERNDSTAAMASLATYAEESDSDEEEVVIDPFSLLLALKIK